MSPSLTLLEELGRNTLQHFRCLTREQFERMLRFETYHGFQKSRLPDEYLTKLLVAYNISPHNLQIEIVEVTSGRREIHYHETTHAVCLIMGSQEHVADPVAAQAYLGDGWFGVSAGSVLWIPRLLHHGFVVDSAKRGTLWFLSLQTPPLNDGRDHDDFHYPDSDQH